MGVGLREKRTLRIESAGLVWPGGILALKTYWRGCARR